MRLVYVNDIWFKNYSMNFVITPSFLARSDRDVTFHSLLVTRWIHSLLVTRCKITRYLLQNSLVTRCRSCSLQKVTCYSLQKLLVAKNHSLLATKFARCSLQKWSHFLQLYEKVTPPQVFSFESLRNFKNTYSVEHYERLLPKIISKHQQTFYSFLRQVFHFDWIVAELFD